MTNTFPKDTGIDELFKMLEKIIEKKGAGADKRVLEIYNNAHIKPQTARGLMLSVVEQCKLDCGCCYRLSIPAADMIVAELTMLQLMLDEAEKVLIKEQHADALKALDHNKRIMQVMITGIKEMGLGSSEIYNLTMKTYASNFHKANPEASKAHFDHIIGMEEAIQQSVERAKAKQ